MWMVSNPSATPETSSSRTRSSFSPVRYVSFPSKKKNYNLHPYPAALILPPPTIFNNLVFLSFFQGVALSRIASCFSDIKKKERRKKETLDWTQNSSVLLATLIIQIIALVMTAIMIYHIRSKYTAVGKETRQERVGTRELARHWLLFAYVLETRLEWANHIGGKKMDLDTDAPSTRSPGFFPPIPPPYFLVLKISLGRKEIIMFFYLYMLVTIMDLLLISGILPTASNLYPVTSKRWHKRFCQCDRIDTYQPTMNFPLTLSSSPFWLR